MRLLLFVLLSGCAAAPSQYRQAVAMPAPVTPPPAYTPGFAPGTPGAPVYTPAGAGLPEVGQPGQRTEQVPRSPNQRVLPASAEPGVWAADDVRASRNEEPHEASDEWFSRKPQDEQPVTMRCRQELTRALQAAGLEEIRAHLPRTPRSCLNARLFMHCTAREANAFRKYSGALTATERSTQQRDIQRAMDLGEKLYYDKCKGPLGPQLEDYISLTIANFERLSEIPL